jgi:hypothetical protein
MIFNQISIRALLEGEIWIVRDLPANAEEGGFDVKTLQDRENLRRKRERRPVIKGQSDLREVGIATPERMLEPLCMGEIVLLVRRFAPGVLLKYRAGTGLCGWRLWPLARA